MKKKIAKAVCGQLINMLENNVMYENGMEPFVGWCADGEVYENMGFTESEIQECMELTKKIGDAVDDVLIQNFDPYFWED